MGEAALLGVAALSAWLCAAGAIRTLQPARALDLLRLTASTRLLNTLEQGLRLLAGAALVVRAPWSKLPQSFEVAGWFIVLSSVVLLVLPLRWHSAYAIWWSKRLSSAAVRTIGPLSCAAGIAILYAAI